MAPLTVSAGFRAFVLEQFDELGDVAPKAMFGGVGLYRRGTFFGILARDALFLRVDARSMADYEAVGAKPFLPFAGRPASSKYYEVPLAVIESPRDLAAWARKAIAAAEA